MKDIPQEAIELVSEEIQRLRALSYSELRGYLGSRIETRKGASGREYELDIQAVWDGRRGGNLRVMIFVAEPGRWGFIDSSVDDFIMAPDGSFIGE